MSTLLETFLAYQVAAGHCPGALALVERAGQPQARHCVGRLHGQGDAAMTERARFRIASLTKPVVSVAALMLADEGRLELEAPVAHYLPVLARLALAGGVKPGRAPTVRDLLRHTAGLAYPQEVSDPAAREAWAQASLAPGSAGMDAAGFLQRLARLPLVSEPGSAFRYGYSTDVLGCVLEAIERRPLGAVLQHRVFQPLGMTSTGFEQGAEESASFATALPNDKAWHAVIPNIGLRRAGQPWMDSGGGGLISTLDDYAAFARLLAYGGVMQGQRLVSEALFNEFTRNQLPTSAEGPASYCGPGFGFGLGLAVRHDWGPAAMPCTPGEMVWSGISGTALFVQPRQQWFALLFSANMASRMVSRLEFRRAVA
jgi:CubicO group peptidase (beta-lactamase class C family)